MIVNSYNIKPKQRHGCLSAYLVFLIVIYTVSLVFRLLSLLAPQNEAPVIIVLANVLLFVFIISCAVAIYKWKKWGVWGLCAAAGINFVVSLFQHQLVILSVIQLVVVLGILFWVLNIGNDDNKAWPQLK